MKIDQNNRNYTNISIKLPHMPVFKRATVETTWFFRITKVLTTIVGQKFKS